MREKRTVQSSIFHFFADHEIGRELQAISNWLDSHPEILELVAADIQEVKVNDCGRKGLPVESVLRCAILKQYRQVSYEELAFYLLDSHSFQAFARLPLEIIPRKAVFATLIDVRLYLPRKWMDNKARCDGARIPIEAQRFKTKPELALEVIRHTSALGVRYNWIGADGLYGNDPTFLRALDEQGEVFLIDVHKDQQIYLEDPEPRRVEAVQKRGRKSTRWQSESTPIRVDQWLKQRPESAWKREVLRDGTKGTVTVEILHQRVWLWDGKEAKGHHWYLLVRWEIPALNEIKYSLSNASEEVSSLKLAQMQGQRYWVERSFQDGKSHAGLDHYQARGWKAWHHHMALVMMAMLFMLEERIEQQEDYPLLTCSDIETLLAHFLPRRDIDVDEIIRQMELRHKKRQASIDSPPQRYLWVNNAEGLSYQIELYK